ncbi:NACHT domain-containing protein [Hamadaea sp. NPDC050747]|uniref:NACHT domain-containing protein n=1 Tax=Hamadaea sp. NPDC050747 TaxID=3155789 RepID=UPI0033DA02C2
MSNQQQIRLLPLRLYRGRFRAISGTTFGENVPDEWLLRLIRRSCDQVSAEVEIGARIFRTQVHRPVDNLDVAYVEVDDAGVPVGADNGVLSRVAVRIAQYARRTADRWRHGEGMTNDTRPALDAWFVPPRLEAIEEQGPYELSGDLAWTQISEHARVVILGAAGAGKTSLLRRMVFEAARDAAGSTIPVYLQLRNFPLGDLTADGVARFLATDDMADIALAMEQPSITRRILLLLDGLDELPSEADRASAIRGIQQLCSRLPEVRVAITSRDAEYRWDLPDFAHFRVLPFDDSQIAQWTYHFVAHGSSVSAWCAFNDELYNSPARDLLTNPLLLSYTTSARSRHSLALSDTSSVVSRCLDVMIDEWDDVRGVTRPWRRSDLSSRQITTMLAELSAQCVEQDRSDFSLDDINRLWKRSVGLSRSPIVFIAACSSIGLVRPVSENRFAFTHHTIQEYLAARTVLDWSDRSHDIIGERGVQSTLARVWMYACGLSSDATPLLENVTEHADLEAWQSVLLVLGALSQQVIASRPAIDRCGALIVDYLESVLQEVEGTSLEDLPAGYRSENLRAVWAMSLVGPSRVLDGSPHLEEIIRVLHQTRDGSARHVIQDHLGRSRLECVRRLGESLEYPGRLSIERFDRDSTTGLKIVIARSQSRFGVPERVSHASVQDQFDTE